MDRPPPFLHTERLLGCFDDDIAAACASYRVYIDADIAEQLNNQVRGERIGSDSFLANRFSVNPPLPEIPRVQIEPAPPPLTEIFTSHTEDAVAIAYRKHGYTLREIADHLGCHYSTISRRLKREEGERQASLQCKT
jgi:AraC-like DNA-binding protein